MGVREINIGEGAGKQKEMLVANPAKHCPHTSLRDFFNRGIIFPFSHTLLICQESSRGADIEECRWKEGWGGGEDHRYRMQ